MIFFKYNLLSSLDPAKAFLASSDWLSTASAKLFQDIFEASAQSRKNGVGRSLGEVRQEKAAQEVDGNLFHEA